MKLGLLTAPFPDTSLMDVADWTASIGMEALEVACWPVLSGDARRYAGTSHIDVDNLNAQQASEINNTLLAKGITVSALGYYPNPLHPDAACRAEAIGHLKKVITAASTMNIQIVNTFVGGDKALNVDENWERAVTVFPEIVAHARDYGVTLAFENCPMIFSYDEWPAGHNIAYSPRIWRRIFEEWGDDVGMNFDPSHLVWQMIDQTRFVREFGSRIVHAHAKDLMIDRDGLYENGIMSVGMGWQIPRMPGLGDVNWGEVFSALYREGYDGAMIVEHEDRNFEATEDLIKKGFLIARDILSPYIK